MKTKKILPEIIRNNLTLFMLIIASTVPYCLACTTMKEPSGIYNDLFDEVLLSMVFIVFNVLLWWFAFALSGTLFINFANNLYGLYKSDNGNVWSLHIKGGSIAAGFFGISIFTFNYLMGFDLSVFFYMNLGIISTWLLVNSIQYYYFNRILYR